MLKQDIIIITFIITALYDIVLRQLSENYDKLPHFLQEYKFIKYLIPYFKKHTILAAALIAGFIGAITQYIILFLHPFPKTNHLNKITSFLIISFIISALFGFVMKETKLFPHLDKTYYKKLGPIRGAYHDGVSGLIVQVTLIIIHRLLLHPSTPLY